jgi:hypothetical protein
VHVIRFLGHILVAVVCVAVLSGFLAVGVAGAQSSFELASAPAGRAIAVSGATPVLAPFSSMKVLAGETAEQLVYATDAGGDALTFSKGSGPDYMTVATIEPGSGTATGRITLAPPFGTSIDLISASVIVSDGVLSDEESFTIVGSQSPPVLLQPSDMRVEPRRTGSQSLHATDADDDPLTFSLALGPWFASVTTEGPGLGTVHLAPQLADSGSHQVSVSVHDGIASDVRTFAVVVPSRTTPILTQPSDMTVTVGQTARQVLIATDADQQVLSFYKVEGPEFLRLTRALIELTPQLEHSPSPEGGEFHIPATIGVTDGERSEEKSFTIHVTFPPDRPPVLGQPGDMTVREGHFGYQDYFVSDPDGERATVTKVSGPDFLYIGWAIFVEPDFDDAGEYLATIRATDSQGLYDEKTFRIIVEDSPSYAWFSQEIGDMAVFGGSTAEQQVFARERDGLPVSFSRCYGPDYVSVSTVEPGTGSAMGLIRLSPGEQERGRSLVKVCLWNGAWSTETSFHVEVLRPGRTGLVGIGDPCLSPGDSIGFRFLALDPEGDPLSFSQSGMPSYGTFVDHGDGTATLALWPLGPESRGSTLMTVTATDGVTSDSEAFAVSVGWCGGAVFGEPPNWFPKAEPGGPYTGLAGQHLTFDGTGSSDRDGQALTFAWNFGDGTVAIGPTVTHEYPESGEYRLELVVSDGLNSDRAAAVVSIEDAPVRSMFLSQNRPNPFNPRTSIEYGLAEPSHVSLRVYDVAGRLVRNLVDAPMAAGVRTAEWDAKDDRGFLVSSGVYYYELRAADISTRHRMVLLR